MTGCKLKMPINLSGLTKRAMDSSQQDAKDKHLKHKQKGLTAATWSKTERKVGRNNLQ